jgi:hypothetical protein
MVTLSFKQLQQLKNVTIRLNSMHGSSCGQSGSAGYLVCFFLISKNLHQCGLYGAAGNPQEITVLGSGLGV